MEQRKSKAFTLLELLVVLAILGILVGVLVPALRQAREAGRAILCKSLQKNYTFALYGYFTETRELLPISVQDPVMRPWFTLDEFRSRVGLPFLTQEYKVRRFPENIQEYKPSYERKYICPSASFALKNPEDGLYPMDRSYGLNAHVYYFQDYIRQRLLSQSGRILCMADALDWWFNWWGCDKYVEYGEEWVGFETYGTAAFRHLRGHANVSFWDGHCAAMSVEQLKQNLDEWMRQAEKY
jgi:prepilin-type N-terminal cleavage/methylation domain-containing protein/prepilin-type processing-associated H-X9-DG protein